MSYLPGLAHLLLVSYLPGLAHLLLVSYHPFNPADSYRHAPASSHIPFDSPRPADPNGALPGPGGPLADELSLLFT